MRRPANGSAETLAMFHRSHVGLSRVWILSMCGANRSEKDRREFVVFSEGFKLKSVAFVLAPLIPLLSCMRKDFCVCWRSDVQTLEKVQTAVQEITILLRRCRRAVVE